MGPSGGGVLPNHGGATRLTRGGAILLGRRSRPVFIGWGRGLTNHVRHSRRMALDRFWHSNFFPFSLFSSFSATTGKVGRPLPSGNGRPKVVTRQARGLREHRLVAQRGLSDRRARLMSRSAQRLFPPRAGQPGTAHHQSAARLARLMVEGGQGVQVSQVSGRGGG